MSRLHIIRTLIAVVIGIVIGLVTYVVTPKTYESSMLLQVGAPKIERRSGDAMSDNIAQMLQTGQPQDMPTEMGVLRGQGLFTNALSRVAQASGRPDLLLPVTAAQMYQMYSVLPQNADTAVNSTQPFGVVVVTARADDPQIAADLANAIAAEYNDLRQRTATNALTSIKEFLAKQLQDSQIALAAADKTLLTAKNRAKMPDPVMTTQQETTVETALRQQRDQTEADLLAAESELASLSASRTDTKPTQVNNSSEVESAAVSRLQAAVADLQSQRAQMAATYSDASPNIKALDAAIASSKRELQVALKLGLRKTGVSTGPNTVSMQLTQSYELAKARVSSLRSRKSALDTLVARQENRNASLSANRTEIERMQVNRAVLEEQYRQTKLQEASFQNQKGPSTIVAPVMFAAVPNPQPVAPSLVKIVLMSAIGCGMLGLAISFVYESSRQRLYSSRHVSELTGLPVVATFPSASTASIGQVVGTQTILRFAYFPGSRPAPRPASRIGL